MPAAIPPRLEPTTANRPMHEFISTHGAPGFVAHTDKCPSYEGLEGCRRETVRHREGEYVRAAVHKNGMDPSGTCSGAAFAALSNGSR